MTSQQDTELPHILDDFAEELKEIRATAREDYYYETHGMSDDIDEAYEKAIQALTSWKDKEVERALMGEICPYHDVWDWRKHRAKLESLQSQGGKNE